MPVATITDPSGQTLHLGRKPADPTSPKLRMAYYLDLAAVAPPDTLDLAAKAMPSISRMYLNDQLGDCVIAGKAHSSGIWTGNDTGNVRVGTDAEIKSNYHNICGPGDNGCNIEDVLKAMEAGQYILGGAPVALDAYCGLDWTNAALVKAAMCVMGPLTLGVNLPNAWTGGSDVWDVTSSRIVGGHDICTCGYNAQGVQICSWGKIFTITWAAFTSRKWLEECWALLSPDWYGVDNVAPGGLKLDQLKADFAKLKNGQIPDIDPPAIFYDFGSLA